MKRIILTIGLVFSLTGVAPVMAAKPTLPSILRDRETTVSKHNTAKLPLWHRIKQAFEQRFKWAFGIKKNAKAIQCAQAPRSSNAKAALSEFGAQERACIETLITLAEAHIVELSAQLHAFFDTKGNKDPYRVHVEKFYQILMKVDKSIASPLKAAIASTQNSEYKKVLELMQNIVQDLHKNLFDAHAAFKKNEDKDPLVAALALGDLKKDADIRRPQIEGKLKTLHTELLKLDKDLANQIDALHKSLPKIFESELSNLVLLNRLKQRLNMKG